MTIFVQNRPPDGFLDSNGEILSRIAVSSANSCYAARRFLGRRGANSTDRLLGTVASPGHWGSPALAPDEKRVVVMRMDSQGAL